MNKLSHRQVFEKVCQQMIVQSHRIVCASNIFNVVSDKLSVTGEIDVFSPAGIFIKSRYLVLTPNWYGGNENRWSASDIREALKKSHCSKIKLVLHLNAEFIRAQSRNGTDRNGICDYLTWLNDAVIIWNKRRDTRKHIFIPDFLVHFIQNSEILS